MEENNLIGHLSELRNRLIKALIFCLVLLVFMFRNMKTNKTKQKIRALIKRLRSSDK